MCLTPMCSFAPCMQNGQTALFLAVFQDRDDSFVRLLLEHKADVNYADEVPRGEGEGVGARC